MVKEFCYLVVWISNDGKDQKEIKCRIGVASKTFHNQSRLLKNQTISPHLQKKIMKCYVWTILKYACGEMWTMSADNERKLHAFIIWWYRI